MKRPKALILTGYGLNCDYETDFSLRQAGAESHRIHINELIEGSKRENRAVLEPFHILIFGGGFSWADDHGAGVIMAAKMRHHLGKQIENFIGDGKLIIGICNGFQCLVNLGLLPGFDNIYNKRRVALTTNKKGNFIDTWVHLKANTASPCVFTKGISQIELPVRHGEGNFFTSDEDIERLFNDNQIALQYADPNGKLAEGRWPLNPNGSIKDIAGICDPTGRIFGLMPHPEAFNHYTNHPDWTRKKEIFNRQGKQIDSEKGDGMKIFENAVEYVMTALQST